MCDKDSMPTLGLGLDGGQSAMPGHVWVPEGSAGNSQHVAVGVDISATRPHRCAGCDGGSGVQPGRRAAPPAGVQQKSSSGNKLENLRRQKSKRDGFVSRRACESSIVFLIPAAARMCGGGARVAQSASLDALPGDTTASSGKYAPSRRPVAPC